MTAQDMEKILNINGIFQFLHFLVTLYVSVAFLRLCFKTSQWPALIELGCPVVWPMCKESLDQQSRLGDVPSGLVDSACGQLNFPGKSFEEIQMLILSSALTLSSHKD